ncbi:MAG: lipoate--protein ligase family protein [Paludibacteraceae bacterium]|nr:lipoate--protein ligase family protein [Paludibacteraceae bacterium]
MLQLLPPANQRLVWYLAMEEYVAQHVSEDTIFFWSVDPTVIFGRHQVIEDEVNLTYCESHNVQFYRRKSGGGCVYADRGNLMTSFISPSPHSEAVFQQYLDMMSAALRKMGAPAVKSEHNDILVRYEDGMRKVSGNACYALPTGSIVHGTMLYDVDFSALQEAITPSREKLAKHGVQSVRQRVINLRPMLSYPDMEVFAKTLGEVLCPNARPLTADEIAAIDELEKPYLEHDFIFGK